MITGTCHVHARYSRQGTLQHVTCCTKNPRTGRSAASITTAVLGAGTGLYISHLWVHSRTSPSSYLLLYLRL